MGLGHTEAVPWKHWPSVQKGQGKLIFKDERSLFFCPDDATEGTGLAERCAVSRSLLHARICSFLEERRCQELPWQAFPASAPLCSRSLDALCCTRGRARIALYTV